MPDPTTASLFKSLDLSSTELKTMNPGFTDAFIVELLSIFRSLATIAERLDVEIDQKLEEVPTDFDDGSVPYVDGNLLVEDNTNLLWDAVLKILKIKALIVNDTTASLLLSTNSDKEVTSVADLTAWIAGVTDKITVADDLDGTITLSISDNFLPNGIEGTDLQPVNDDGDGTVSLNDDKLKFYIQAVA